MKVLVDTSVWSLALRRLRPDLNNFENTLREELADLIQDGRVQMLGPIRQELLSGIRDQVEYRRLRNHLRVFDDAPLTREDYEEAAAASNHCRAAGISGPPADFLICAMASRHHWPILTTDRDFHGYAKHLPILLYTPPRGKIATDLRCE